MKYFVSIENTAYMRWQLKLLQASMGEFADQLLVAVCDTPYEKPETLNCRTFKHENIGLNIGYSPINKPYALMNAVAAGVLKQPFTVIDPDMVFLKPITEENVACASQWMWHMEIQFLEAELGWFVIKDMGLDLPREKWIPCGCVYQFNDVPNDIFEEMYYACADLAAFYKPGDGKLKNTDAYWVREMLAFAWPMSYLTDVKLVNNFQMPLNPELDRVEKDACLIHYCGSFRPYFDKHKFHLGHKDFDSTKCPYKTIMEIPSGNYRVKAVKKIVEGII